MIIGFTGVMGSGKSTAIEMLKEKLPLVRLIKFAQPLYDIQEYVYERIQDVYTRPESFIKDRALLQWLGTNWGRDTVSETLWVDIWKAMATKHLSKFAATVVSDDVRFDNEAETVKALGGVVVKIFSSDTNKRIDTSQGIVHHKSESGIDHKYIDYFIDNNGTLEDLRNQVVSLVNELNERNSKNGI